MHNFYKIVEKLNLKIVKKKLKSFKITHIRFKFTIDNRIIKQIIHVYYIESKLPRNNKKANAETEHGLMKTILSGRYRHKNLI